MNAQRKAIYKKRKNALFGDRLDMDIDNTFYDVAESVSAGRAKTDFNDFELDLLRTVGIQSPVSESDFDSIEEIELVEKVYGSVREQYDRKNAKISEKAMPQIKHVHETMSDQYKNIVFPLTDGRREMQLVVNLEEAYESGGKAITTNFEKNITLGMIDNEWKEHLREMDDLRSAVHHAQYEQKDPLLVYKLESFELFKRMLDRLNNETMDLLMKMDIPVEQIQTTNQSSTKSNSYAKAKESSSSHQEEVGAGTEANRQAAQNSGAQRPMEKQQPVTVEKTVGRNEPCPCGSGKKFKQCHGKK